MIGIIELYRVLNHLIIIRWYSEMFMFHKKIVTAIVKKYTVIKMT